MCRQASQEEMDARREQWILEHRIANAVQASHTHEQTSSGGYHNSPHYEYMQHGNSQFEHFGLNLAADGYGSAMLN